MAETSAGGVERFSDRHLGPDTADDARMLAALEMSTLDELTDRTVPESIRTRDPLQLPGALSEPAALERLR
jgi:glycine dehydrogenase